MRLDRNGYRPNLFGVEDGFCFLHEEYCGTERHEIFGGANRGNSKKYGLWIPLCPSCHREGENAIHKHSNTKYLYIKEDAQRLFEIEYPDKDFKTIFGRNYL